MVYLCIPAEAEGSSLLMRFDGNRWALPHLFKPLNQTQIYTLNEWMCFDRVKLLFFYTPSAFSPTHMLLQLANRSHPQIEFQMRLNKIFYLF